MINDRWEDLRIVQEVGVTSRIGQAASAGTTSEPTRCGARWWTRNQLLNLFP